LPAKPKPDPLLREIAQAQLPRLTEIARRGTREHGLVQAEIARRIDRYTRKLRAVLDA